LILNTLFASAAIVKNIVTVLFYALVLL